MTIHDLTLIPGGAGVVADTEVLTLDHLIGGDWVASTSGARIERVSPATGQVVSRAARGGMAEAEAALRAARAAFDDGRWRDLPGSQRAKILARVADRIDADRANLARLETLESGKPITQAEAEIAAAADIWRYAATLAWNIRGDSQNALGAEMLGMVLKEPVGVVSIITPWNFPFLIVSQKLPFALAAGCTAVVKPSELTPGTTVLLGGYLTEAGVPAGVVNIVLGYGDPVGTVMTTDKDVDMVSFTGSTAVGKAIAAAGSATLKKVSLELGGKNPQVVFADADLDQAADAIVFGICFNAGECCNSGSRVIVNEDVTEALCQKVVALSRKVPFGDPLNPATKVGAIISPEHRAKIHGYVQDAEAAGATIVLGGEPLAIAGLPGEYYQPTVISDVTADMAIAREEVFGPVLSVLSFATFDEAVALANDAAYGLSAGVWSENVHTCLDFARRVQAGTVWTNTWMDGFPELPFGGVKQSGQGRELGPNGIEEFLESKTVQMRIGKTRPMWV